MTKQNYDEIKLSIPSDSEYIAIVRLMVSGVCARMDFSVEDIEDIKIAISEACTNVVLHAYDDGQKNYFEVIAKKFDLSLSLTVQDFGKGFDVAKIENKMLVDVETDSEGLGLGLTFIKNLMDELTIESTPNKGTLITMVKHKKEPNA